MLLARLSAEPTGPASSTPLITVGATVISGVLLAGPVGSADSRANNIERILMKPATILIIGALVVALAIVGYLYYQRTRNDITIQLPKLGSIVDRNDLWHAA